MKTKKIVYKLVISSASPEISHKVIDLENRGVDEILIMENTTTVEEHEMLFHTIKDIASTVDIPLLCAGKAKRLEDVKKFLYAGCTKVFLDITSDSEDELIKEASLRFGRDKIGLYPDPANMNENIIDKWKEYVSTVLIDSRYTKNYMMFEAIESYLLLSGQKSIIDTAALLKTDRVQGVIGGFLNAPEADYMVYKHQLKEQGVMVNTFESLLNWNDMKLNSDGMLPVVVQDYKTAEVLMMAYMNEESFHMTIQTGRMTYYSRSRKELWVKGLTSGHFQYVKKLTMDCDRDTLLAQVHQVGAACHTGRRSCFFEDIVKKDYMENNPLKVFEAVYQVIEDRKENPKEGSYTNYLFDKGIDKILKKLGEEAAEIIIASKNPDKEEIKYEISDFLYHMMVLMVEKGVAWEDITKELAKR